MTRQELVEQIKTKESYLCIGLDTDPQKMPERFKYDDDGIFQFNKAIIDATKDLCVSYKINTAFYEAEGLAGWRAMIDTVNYIPRSHFMIADAKRADIGNTSDRYARAFFDTISFDAVTIAPYMGRDSVQPFLGRKDKWAIVLGLTSNQGASDFELMQLKENDEMLYEQVLKKVSSWGDTGNLMFVIGATQSDAFLKIRQIVPDHFLLVPGIGFQGGSLEEISKDGLTADCGLLVNVSRAIIYAGNGEQFDEEAREIASQYQREMAGYLRWKGIT